MILAITTILITAAGYLIAAIGAYNLGYARGARYAREQFEELERRKESDGK